MNQLERQYLVAAYELAKTDPMHRFEEDEITNRLDLDPTETGFSDRFISLTSYHLEMGNIESLSKGRGMGRRTLKLTSEGMEQAERLSDPVEQRKEQRLRFLRAVYERADGNPAELVYWRDLAPEYGRSSETRTPSDVRGVAQQLAGSGLITIEGDAAHAFRITAAGVDKVEGNESREGSGPTFQIYGDVLGSVIGTHNTAELTNTFDFRAIEQRIEREGGEDKEELRRALAQVERLLERGDYLDRGALARFSGAMEKHSWFTGSVMQALLGFATQAGG